MTNPLDSHKHCASIVAYMFSMNIPGAYPPGGFAESFMIAYQKADVFNRLRMKSSFVLLTSYMDIAMGDPYDSAVNSLKAGMAWPDE